MQTQHSDETNLRSFQGSFEQVPSGSGAMAVMGVDGDTKHIWDKNNEAETAAAKALFETLVNDKRYSAFKVDDKGETGEGPIREFNSEEERYIFVPPMQGG